MADRVGFEPTVSCPTPHFECGALDHYATCPGEIMTQKCHLRYGRHGRFEVFLDFRFRKWPA